MSRDLYFVTRRDVQRVAKLLRSMTDRKVRLTRAQDAISRAIGFKHWSHFNAVSTRREADEAFQPIFYPEPEDDELDDAADRLSEYLQEQVDSESFSVEWAREFLKKAWSRGETGVKQEAKAHVPTDEAPFADAVSPTKEADFVPNPQQVDVLVTPEAPQGFTQAGGPGRNVKPGVHRVNAQASDGDGSVGKVDADAVRPRRPVGSGNFWSLTRDSGPAATVSYRRRRRLPVAWEVPTVVAAPEVLTEAVAPEVPAEVAALEVPTQPAALEAPTETVSPGGPTEPAAPAAPIEVRGPDSPREVAAPEVRRQKQRHRKSPTEATAQEVPTQASAPEVPTEAAGPEVRRQKQRRRKSPTEATAQEVPTQAAAPEVPTEAATPELRRQKPQRRKSPTVAAAPEVPTQAAAPEVQIEVAEAHKELVAPKARKQAVARERRMRAVTPKALKTAVAPEMPTEKPRALRAATHRELLAELATVNAQLEKLRAELPSVVEKIQRLMREYDLSIDDIAVKPRRGRSVGTGVQQSKAALPARYRDPKTGKTWSGRGRAPAWLGKKPGRYLIAAG